jgi:anti-sigma regulatory factor (Ser/Thr protein kinase)
MYELALFILDLAQNSLSAGASVVKIWVLEDGTRNRMTVTVADNGCGMTSEVLKRALDPFMTSKAARRKSIGLGLPFFRQLAEDCQGRCDVRSRPGIGTVVTGTWPLDNLDQPQLGALGDTFLTLVAANPCADFRFVRRHADVVRVFDTRAVRAVLGVDAERLWQTPEMTAWFRTELTPFSAPR